jgi:hypothetical protein
MGKRYYTECCEPYDHEPTIDRANLLPVPGIAGVRPRLKTEGANQNRTGVWPRQLNSGHRFRSRTVSFDRRDFHAAGRQPSQFTICIAIRVPAVTAGRAEEPAATIRRISLNPARRIFHRICIYSSA